MLSKEQIEFFLRFNKATRKNVVVQVYPDGYTKEKADQVRTEKMMHYKSLHAVEVTVEVVNKVYVLVPEKKGPFCNFVVCIANREPIRVEDSTVIDSSFYVAKPIAVATFQEKLTIVLKHRNTPCVTFVKFYIRDTKGGAE